MADSGNNFQVAKVVIPFEVDPESLRKFGEELSKQIADSMKLAMDVQKNTGTAHADAATTVQQVARPDEDRVHTGVDGAWTRDDVFKLLESVEKISQKTELVEATSSQIAEVVGRIEPGVVLGPGGD